MPNKVSEQLASQNPTPTSKEATPQTNKTSLNPKTKSALNSANHLPQTTNPNKMFSITNVINVTNKTINPKEDQIRK